MIRHDRCDILESGAYFSPPYLSTFIYIFLLTKILNQDSSLIRLTYHAKLSPKVNNENKYLYECRFTHISFGKIEFED